MNKYNEEFKGVILLAFAYAIALIPLSLELPSLYKIASSFGFSAQVIKLSITLFWAMFTVGQFVCAFVMPYYRTLTTLRYVMIAYVMSFLLSAFVSQGYLFILLRLVEGFCCGALLLLGRYSMAMLYGHDESIYVRQFARLSACVSTFTILSPIIGGLISAYGHWRMIYVLLACLGWMLYWVHENVFTDKSPIKKPILNSFQTMLGNVYLLLTALLSGFSRSILINFNANLALYLQEHNHWSALEYGALIFSFSGASILARMFLPQLKERLGQYVLNCFLCAVMFVSCLSIGLTDQTMVYYIIGVGVTVSSGLLTMLYSLNVQYRLAKHNQAMSLAVMGVVQNFALVTGTMWGIFLSTDSLLPLMKFIMCSAVLIVMINHYLHKNNIVLNEKNN